MPSKLKKAIAAVKDQTSISLAKVSSNTSSNLEVAVLKATTHDVVPIEDKYVHEVLQVVSSNKAHAAACARAIGKRIGRTRNWVVALKSLMLVLRIFQDGDPYFPREVLHAMKRGAKILNLSSFRDDSNSSPWDFTAFVRTFALYLDERLECFLTGKLQRRYTHGERPNAIHYKSNRSMKRPTEPVRDMKPAILIDKISYWQRLLERAIATRPTGAAKANRLVQISLYAIVQESFDLYKDISDGLALILDSFFHLQYQNCVTAFQTCIRAAKQFEELSAFYSLCKSIGVGRSSEYPSVQTMSEELIETLQEYLKDQSSFPNSVKSTNRLLLPSPPPSVSSRSSRQSSFGGRSEFSTTTDGYSISEFSQCTSLEELIRASETGIAPAISIDLETYPATKREEDFRISDTGSARSLPVSTSMVDLVSLEDWYDDDEQEKKKDQPQEEKEKGNLGPSVFKNWEDMLAETVSSSASSQLLSDNNTNTFNAFPERTPLPPADTALVPTGNRNSTSGWELVLFEPAPPQQPPLMQPVVSNIATPPSNHYNPFLEDTVELPPPSAVKLPAAPHPPPNLSLSATPIPPPAVSLPAVPNPPPAVSAPTFRAIPTFTAQIPDQNLFPVPSENDPFGGVPPFSGEQMLNTAANQQSFLLEQQLWLQNQSKIIAKHQV